MPYNQTNKPNQTGDLFIVAKAWVETATLIGSVDN